MVTRTRLRFPAVALLLAIACCMLFAAPAYAESELQAASVSDMAAANEGATDISGAVIDVHGIYYDGRPLNADTALTVDTLTVTLGEGADMKTLHKGADFTVAVEGEDLTNAGKDITLTITGMAPAYTGSASKTFQISPRDLTNASVSFSTSVFAYTGEAIEPTVLNVTCYNPTFLLVPSEGYSVTYRDNINAGTATAKITGTAPNFTGYKEQTFTISKAYPGNFEVTFDEEFVYDGTQKKPRPKVTFNHKELTEGVEFTYKYPDNDSANVGAGTGYMYIYGAGNNFDSSSYKYVNFEIAKRSIDLASVSAIAAQTYTGSAVTPEFTVKDLGNNLTLYSDYYVAYADNTNPGTATITLTGYGNYKDTKTATFKIKPTGTVPKLTAKKGGSGKILLSWNAIYGATKYGVYEKMPNGKLKAINTKVKMTYGAVSPLSATRAHTFLVRAYVNGKWSKYTKADMVTIKPSGPIKPKARAASASKSTVWLNWGAVPGATRYSVSSLNSDGSLTLLTNNYTNTAVTLTGLTGGKKHTYLVRAYIDGKWSKFTKKDFVSVSTNDPRVPPSVTVKDMVKDGQVTFTWDAISDASRYSVAEKLSSKKWKIYTSKLKKTTYTISDLSAKTHVFRIRAFADGKWSKLFKDFDVYVIPSGDAKPIVEAKSTMANSTKLTWKAVPGAKKYAVAVQNADGTTFTYYTKKLKKTATSYKVKNLETETTYKFLVRAYVDGAWTEYTSSDLVTVTTF